MKIICSWCRQEGRTELVGEKAPLDDERETHGICVTHRRQVQIHWQEAVFPPAQTGQNQSTGLSRILARWTGLLNLTKKVCL